MYGTVWGSELLHSPTHYKPHLGMASCSGVSHALLIVGRFPICFY